MQVRLLWEDHYRVNILVGLDAASAKVAHSYLVTADSDGNIVAATPKARDSINLRLTAVEAIGAASRAQHREREDSNLLQIPRALEVGHGLNPLHRNRRMPRR